MDRRVLCSAYLSHESIELVPLLRAATREPISRSSGLIGSRPEQPAESVVSDSTWVEGVPDHRKEYAEGNSTLGMHLLTAGNPKTKDERGTCI
jgi:hypothetical protein